MAKLPLTGIPAPLSRSKCTWYAPSLSPTSRTLTDSAGFLPVIKRYSFSKRPTAPQPPIDSNVGAWDACRDVQDYDEGSSEPTCDCDTGCEQHDDIEGARQRPHRRLTWVPLTLGLL